MTDDSSNDWSTKVNKLASRTKEVAVKGLESSKDASKNLATKSKQVAVKGLEGTKSAVQSISKASHKHLENRKEKKARGKDTSEFEVIPLTDNIPVTEGAKIESPLTEDFSGFTVDELKMRLKFLGLAVGGKKDALIERLKLSRKVKTQTDESSVLDDLEIRIQLIEEEYPEVLKPLPPEKDEDYSQILKNSLYYVCGFTLIVYSILLLLPAVVERYGDSIFGLPFIEFFLPTWFSPEQIQPMATEFHLPFVALGALTVFLSGVLLLQKKNTGATLLCVYFVGVLLIGRLVYFFQSDILMVSNDYSNLSHDIFLTFIVCGFAILPRAFYPISNDDVQHSITITGVKSMILAENPNTDANLEQIIQEGFNMDFRTEVARPKTPRARAKFETYEKILLIVSLFLWPFTIFMTMAYDNGLVAFTEYSSEIVQVVSVWAISLLTLISLVRFDRSARGNGWHTKEKEIYVGMMDLYSKAQAKHYEYVELRAAAEAQEILEKYPQLDRTKTGSASKA